MIPSALQGALEALYGLERRKDKFGLDGTRELLGALGYPERRFRSVQVAGTNGKGSVCALVERVLRASGRRTGLFTSPHLVDFRERIRVDGRWADEAWLAGTLGRIERLPGGGERTFFEVATALGFAWFAERQVEWAVVEVGLGGRLDSTNVLAPELCVITSIGLDHTELLGDTVESIAAEKAGIIKPGTPVVMGASMDPRAAAVIRATAREVGAPVVEGQGPVIVAESGCPCWNVVSDSPWGELEELAPSLAGEMGLTNAATALVTLAQLRRSGADIPREAVIEGFEHTRWPGRFECCPTRPRLTWDGAHNVHGATALVRSWRHRGLPAPAAIVLASSRDKDIGAMLAALSELAGAGCVLFVTRTRNPRALEPEALAQAARAAGLDARVAPSVSEACEMALALPGEAPVLLTGSLFAVGEAMEAFGGAPGEWQ